MSHSHGIREETGHYKQTYIQNKRKSPEVTNKRNNTTQQFSEDEDEDWKKT